MDTPLHATSASPGLWTGGSLPANVQLGQRTVVTGDEFTAKTVFRHLKSTRSPAITIGADGHLYGVTFNLGTHATVNIGDGCHLQDCLLIAELDIRIGHHVTINFHATVVDSDFHPIPAQPRIADTIAIAPGSPAGAPRPPFVSRPIVIEDDVWIGPLATILKGVRIGEGAIIEPGSVVTRDVPPRARVMGNPARLVETPP